MATYELEVGHPFTQDEEEGISVVLQKVNRILSGYPHLITSEINIAVATGRLDSKVASRIPALTDIASQQIFINYPLIENLMNLHDLPFEAKMVAILAFNYHELAHALHTRTQPPKDKQHLKRIMNSIEDGRIETLFSTTYPKAKKMFAWATLRVIAKQKVAEQFILLYGRRSFLPKRVIDEFEELMKQKYGDADTEEVKKQIDIFMTASAKEQINAAETVYNILNKKGGQNNVPEGGMGGAHGEVVEGHGPKSTGQPSDIDKEAMKEVLKRLKELAKKGELTEGEGDVPTDLPTEGEGKPGEGKGEGEKPSKKPGDKAGKGEGEGIEDIFKQLDEELTQDTQDLTKEAEKVIEQIREENRDYEKATGRFHPSPPPPTTPEITGSILRLRTLLRKITDLLGATIVRNRRFGKLDVKSVMKVANTGGTAIFKKKRMDSRERAKITAVLLVDSSGSMSGNKEQAARTAGWVLSEAIEKNEGKVAVILYSDDNAYVTKKFRKPGNWREGLGGGTNPSAALKLAHDLLMTPEEKRHIRLLVNITDGQWSGVVGGSERWIEKMNKDGVETIEIGIDVVSNHGSRHRVMIPNHAIHTLSSVLLKTIKNIEKGVASEAGVI